MLTVIEILKLSEEYLAKHGVPDARRNAELLASHVLGKSRLDLYLEHERPLDDEEVRNMRAALAQRKDRKPIQYIFGEAEFYGLPFEVDPSVLVPRPETELLVEESLRALKETRVGKAVVYEVGTGSGCISVSVAKNFDNCRIYASDISTEALKIASGNAAKNDVSEKIEFLLGHDLKPFRDAGAPQADLVVSNPPYVPTAELQNLEPEVRDYEPTIALDGGPDGLDVIKRFIDQAPGTMSVGGTLLLEIGIGQSRAVTDYINSSGCFDEPGIVKDYQDIDRIVIVKLKKQAV